MLEIKKRMLAQGREFGRVKLEDWRWTAVKWVMADPHWREQARIEEHLEARVKPRESQLVIVSNGTGEIVG